MITSSSLDRDEGITLLEQIIEKIKKSIEANKGRFKVKMPPKVITDIDEAALAHQLDMLEAENDQVDGDSDSDASDSDDLDDEENEDNLDNDPKLKAISGLMENINLGDDAGNVGEGGGDDDDDDQFSDDEPAKPAAKVESKPKKEEKSSSSSKDKEKSSSSKDKEKSSSSKDKEKSSSSSSKSKSSK